MKLWRHEGVKIEKWSGVEERTRARTVITLKSYRTESPPAGAAAAAPMHRGKVHTHSFPRLSDRIGWEIKSTFMALLLLNVPWLPAGPIFPHHASHPSP